MRALQSESRTSFHIFFNARIPVYFSFLISSSLIVHSYGSIKGSSAKATRVSVASNSLSNSEAMLKSLGIDPSILNEEEQIKENTNESSQDIQKDLSRRERDPDWWRDPLAMFEESDEESAEDISSESSSNDSSEDDAEINSGEIKDKNDQLNDSQEPLIIENVVPSNKENEEENEFGADSLPADAQRRLAQHSILMKQPQGSLSTQTTSPNFSAPAIPALLLVSKLRSIVPFVPSYIVTLFVSLAGTQYILAHFKNQSNQQKQQQMMDDESEEFDQDESDSTSFLSKIRKPFMKKSTSHDYFEQNDDDENTDYRNKKRNGRSFFQQSPDHDSKRKKNLNSSNQSVKIQQKEAKEDLQEERRMRFKSKKELMEQIQFWKERTDKAEYENEQLIAQSERMSREMASIQAQSSTLQSSMRYLKSQLRDNQKEAENAILKERQETEKEMAKVRDALLKVLHHERNLMREQVKKTSAQVRALLAEHNNQANNKNTVDEIKQKEDQIETAKESGEVQTEKKHENETDV